MSKNTYMIGVTGHRYLPEEKLPALTRYVNDFLAETMKNHSETTVTVMSALAEGADMLCAKLALDMGLRLVIPLPMGASEYRKDFHGNAASMFDCLLSMADEVFTVTPEEPVPAHPPRGFYYRQANIYIAKHSNILLAIWDGVRRETPDRAGTWETIKLAQDYGKKVYMMGGR